MDQILQLISGNLGKQVVESVSQGSGASKEDTQSVMNAALPVLFGALQNNAKGGGADGILNAINKKHDGSILDKLSGALGADVAADGKGILQHVLGGNQAAVQQALSQKTGVSAATVGKILAFLAPIVMGYLGKQAKSSSVNNGGGLSDLLGSLVGSGAGGDLLGSLLGGGGKSSQSAGGLGGLLGGLGGLFGKK